MKSFVTIIALIALAGCSVRQKEAASNPPVIPAKLTSFASEYGSLEISAFNAFLNPEFRSEAEAVAYFGQLTKIKGQIAVNQKMGDALYAEIIAKRAQFIADCRELAATPADFDEIEGVIRNYKQAADQAEEAKIAACQKNFEDRKEGLKQQSKYSIEVARAQVNLWKFVDPNWDGENPDSFKLAKLLHSGTPSQIRIRENGKVDVELNGFIYEENNQSTKASKTTLEGAQIKNAAYFPGKQILTFQVPEVRKVKVEREKRDENGNPVLDENGNPVRETVESFELTGNSFLFQLGRGADSYGTSNFGGKFKLLDSSGAEIRDGRAIIGGKLQ